MRSEPSWQELFSAVLHRWGGAAAGEGETAPEWIPARALDRLAAAPAEERPRLVGLLRQSLHPTALDRVHPSWVVRALPADPLLGRWCRTLLPAAMRRALGDDALAADGTDGTDGSGAPVWLERWWRRELRFRIPVPAPLPWSHDPRVPLSFLWRLPTDGVLALLARQGLRPFAAIFSRVEAATAARLAYAVPDEVRERLVAHVKQGDHPDGAAWERVYRELEGAGTGRHDLPVGFALKELAATAVARDRGDDARRLAYRLPAVLGGRLLADLEGGDPALAAADVEAWDAAMRQAVTELELEVPPP